MDAVGRAAIPAWKPEQTSSGRGFDWVMVALCAWMQGGGFLDGWAHNHSKVDASFFTPWHAVLYTGFLAVAGWVGGTLVYHWTKGAAWRHVLPAGYELSFLGIVVFAAGGAGDLLWHTLVGVEQSVEALYSPSHLILGVGSALIMSGPWRAAWERPTRVSPARWGEVLPMLLSLTFTLSGFTFSAQVIHPLVPLRRMQTLPATHELLLYLQALTIASVLIQTLLKMGAILLALRRWRLPPGSITLMFTLNGLLMCMLDPHDDYVLMVPVMFTGLVADGLLAHLQPWPERPWRFRLFAFVVPVLFYLCYFMALLLLKGFWWSVHLWTGAIVLAGLAGWLLSYLIVPPQEARDAPGY